MATEDAVTEKEYNARVGFRHVQVLLLFLVMTLVFSFRSNISLAIVAMTDSDNENYFDWSIQQQSVILSAIAWGDVFTMFPAGELAARFGGKLMLVICMSINTLVCFFLPISAYYGGWKLVCACRVLQGVGSGLLIPTMHNLVGKWAPVQEKSRLGTFVFSGIQAGIAVQMLVSGFITDILGWPWVFYFNAIVGLGLVIIYIIFGSDSPQTSKWMSKGERFYIQTSLGQIGDYKKLPAPWKKMWTSLPFISLIAVSCGQAWGVYTLMTMIPTYMYRVQGVTITATGWMSAIPYIAMVLMGFPFGYISDYVIKKQWCSITLSRKISNSIGFFGPGLALIGLSYAPADTTIAVVYLTAVVALNAGHFTGYLLVFIDMAPNFAGTLSGISNGLANMLSIFAPLAAGLILTDETNADEWRHVFYLSSAIYIGTNTLFLIFGNSRLQPWNEPMTGSSATLETDVEGKEEELKEK